MIFRRVSVALCKRSLAAILLLCLGCAAQSSSSPELNRRIERQVRLYFSVPPSVQVAVGPRKSSSDFPGYDTLEITFTQGDKKQTHQFLLSQDGKTLIRPIKLDVSKDPYAEAMSKISVQGRPVRGNPNAKITIVNFDDFQCPFCSRFHQMLFSPDFWKQYGDRVKVIYKDYPLSDIHPWADHAAVNANCLAAQNSDAYWDFADYVHANQKEISGTDPKPPYAPQFAALDKVTLETGQRHKLEMTALEACVKAQQDGAVKASVKEADGLGVSATPTFFVNGQKVDGLMPPQEFRAMVDDALRDAGVTVPAAPAAAAKPAGN